MPPRGEGRRHAARRRPGVPPRRRRARPYLLFVGAIQERKNPLARAAATAVGLPLVVVGPRRRRLAEHLRVAGADLRGQSRRASSRSSTAAPPRSSTLRATRGSGSPVVEAMASGRPSSPRRRRPCARLRATRPCSLSQPTSPRPSGLALERAGAARAGDRAGAAVQLGGDRAGRLRSTGSCSRGGSRRSSSRTAMPRRSSRWCRGCAAGRRARPDRERAGSAARRTSACSRMPDRGLRGQRQRGRRGDHR